MLSIRKIGVIGRTYRHLNRYSQILGVLLKYGFGDMIERLRIDQYIESGLRMIGGGGEPGRGADRLTRAQRFRMALEELGPAYIKLGQALSTRADLMPPDFITELSRLQDDVPCREPLSVRTVIAEAFGRPAEELFDEIDETPIAAASIGQVHRGRLPDGEIVAVKIQRPGIRRVLEVDLEIMLHLATLTERHIEEIALLRPVRIVEEFARRLDKEIDYPHEAASMERFGRQFLGDPTIFVPHVHHDLTTEGVLTMEFVEGVKLSSTEELSASGLDPRLLTARGADLFLRQVFDHGFFHADPHPGNIMALPGNIVCLLDFGTMGTVDRATREDFVDLLEGILSKDPSKAAGVMLRLAQWDEDPDRRDLERDIAEFMSRHLYRPLREIQVHRVISHLFELMARHRLRIGPDIFFMLKAFSTVEGVALRLDPDFDMFSHALPFLERVKLARYSPQRITADVLRVSSNLLEFMDHFPRDAMDISRQIRQRKLTLRMEHPGVEHALGAQERIGNRMAVAIVIAALIMGASLMMVVRIPPLFHGVSAIGLALFLGALLMGGWLLAAILRKGGL